MHRYVVRSAGMGIGPDEYRKVASFDDNKTRVLLGNFKSMRKGHKYESIGYKRNGKRRKNCRLVDRSTRLEIKPEASLNCWFRRRQNPIGKSSSMLKARDIYLSVAREEEIKGRWIDRYLD